VRSPPPKPNAAPKREDANSFFANQGWYDNAIAPFRVDPANPNIVFVGGIDLFRSDDGGVNWGLASHSLGGQERAAVAPTPIITRWSFIRRCNGASIALDLLPRGQGRLILQASLS
jgi:hypothetical protein